jgi:hypothetical protein
MRPMAGRWLVRYSNPGLRFQEMTSSSCEAKVNGLCPPNRWNATIDAIVAYDNCPIQTLTKQSEDPRAGLYVQNVRKLMNKAAATAVALAATALLSTSAAPTANAAITPTVVTIDANHVLATVGGDAVGVNDWGTDSNLHAPGSSALLAQDGVRVRELNAGPFDDVYRWQTNTYDSNPISDPLEPGTPVSWQSWVREAQRSGSQMMVHVNYGSTATDGPGGTDIGPQQAAAWVRQANIVDHDHIKYWAVGEEVWDNGFYSSIGLKQHEPDNHADKSPAAYGRNVVAFAKAMKAVDPSIKIGVELSPFGTVGPGGIQLPDWNDPVLAAAGGSIDFVDVHSYDYGPGDDASVLASTARIAGTMRTVRGQINASAGPRAGQIQFFVGETNIAPQDPGVQSHTMVSALYSADDIVTWLEQGASMVDWFDARHPAFADTTTSPDDPTGTGYGTWGMLSDGPTSCATNAVGQPACEPALNTKFPAYYGYGMATRLAVPGAKLVATSGAAAPIVSHAALRPDGSLVVLLENEDPAAAHDVALSFLGYRPLPVGIGYSYGQNSSGVAVHAGAASTVSLPPYSMTELVLFPQS